MIPLIIMKNDGSCRIREPNRTAIKEDHMKRLLKAFANSVRLQAIVSLIGLAGLILSVAISGTLLVRGIQSHFNDATIASEAMDALQKVSDNTHTGRLHILLGAQHDPGLEISKLHDHDVELHLKRIEEARTAGAAAVKQLMTRIPTSAEAKELAKTFDDISSTGFAPAIELFKSGKHQQAAALATPSKVPGYNQFESLSGTIGEKLAGWTAVSREDADEKANLSIKVLAGASILILIVCVLYYIFAIRPLMARLTQLKTLAENSARGRLDIEPKVGRQDEIGIVISAFNAMIISYKTMIGKLLFESKVLGTGAGHLLETSHAMAVESQKQAAEVQSVAAAVEELSASMASVDDKAKDTLEIASIAEKRAGAGKQVGSTAATNMESVGAAVQGAATAMNELTERSRAISGITASIKEIADQTNLLALNAAIEAARAGEQGRGFAVVADEVRKLAEKSAAAAAEITKMIAGVQSNVDKSAQAIDAATQIARTSADMARQMAGTLGQIEQGAAETSINVSGVALAVSEQAKATQMITGLTNTIHAISEHSEAQAHTIEREVQYISNIASGFNEINRMFSIEKFTVLAMSLHEAMQAKAIAISGRLQEAIEAAIRSGRISEAAVFDDKYVPIANTDPAKFHTQYDQIFDQILTSIQEAALDSTPEVVYAIAIDRNAYVPTHNQRFSKPLTGNPKIDLIGNRTKRKFTDPVGQACGKSEMPYLLQTYRRDTGEIMHDMSAPIKLCGRHWGGFRIGYLPPA
jgi:methyl-accepting chemotaxis protein